jgi:hypothetical protein
MRARALAWVLWAATVLLVAGALFLGLANRPEVAFFDVPFLLISLTFATLGGLISCRRPRRDGLDLPSQSSGSTPRWR